MRRRTLKLLGYAILLVTVGVVSCQSLFSAPLPQPESVSGAAAPLPSGERPRR